MRKSKKKPWRSMTDADIDRIWRERCHRCKYRGAKSGSGCCNYLVQTGHSRGCRPDECTKFMEGARIIKVVRLKPKKKEPSGKKPIERHPARTHFGAAIDQYLRREEMKQREFAAKLGLKENCVSEWRRGKTKPKGENLIKACNLLGIEVSEGEQLVAKGML